MTTRSGKRIHSSYGDDSSFDAIPVPVRSSRSKRQRENTCKSRGDALCTLSQMTNDCSADACPGPGTKPEADVAQLERKTLKNINGQPRAPGRKKQTSQREIVSANTVIKSRDKKGRRKNDRKQQNICDTTTIENGDSSKTTIKFDNKVKSNVSLSDSFHSATDGPNSETDTLLASLPIPRNASSDANVQLNLTFDCDSGSSLRTLDATYDMHSGDEALHDGKHLLTASAEASHSEMGNVTLRSAGTSPVLLDDTFVIPVRTSGDRDVSETKAHQPLIREGTFTKECPQAQKSSSATLGTAPPLCKRKRSAERSVSRSSPAAEVRRVAFCSPARETRRLPPGPGKGLMLDKSSVAGPGPAPGTPAPRRRVPDFAALHKRQFEAMESLQECQRRRALRAQRLLRPVVASPRPRPEPVAVAVAVEARQPTASGAPSYTRFGFRLPPSVKPFSMGVSSAAPPFSMGVSSGPRSGPMPSLRGATWERRAQAMARRPLRGDRDAKPVALAPVPAPPQERRARSRTFLQGVRTNRRFELQMKARNMPF